MLEAKNLSTIEKVIFLKSVDIFEHATVEQLGRIAGLMEEVNFEARETIYNEGDAGDALYVILSGRVALERNDSTIRELNELKEKEAFGTLEVLDFHPRAANAKAIDQVRALKLNGQEFHDLLSVDFEMVEAVLRMLCGVVRRVLTLVP
ncbi:MAG TPA: cyclic nucleotide-binding domain-containing protein [Candidatus Binatia bacterium]|nr:cyclic nucleotide-binding domain-containing protein [Candidatus Binatia bacterium]